jgi:uncharacterized protein
LPGHEVCQLILLEAGWKLAGTAIFSYERQPCHLDYQITCDSNWRTLSAKVKGWVGTAAVCIQVVSNPDRRWWLNKIEQTEIAGCYDLDLNFSPSTNLLPIRRLNLAVGEGASIQAAWLKFPEFTFALLPQKYTHLEESLYRYESAGDHFRADLSVSSTGFVLDYPGLWVAEATSTEIK